MNHVSKLIVAAGAAISLSGAAHGQVFTWTSVSGGMWGTASNWSPVGGPPNGAGDSAVIDTASIVNLSGISPSVDALTISHAMGELRINNNQSFTLNGNSTNFGTITINPEGGGNFTFLTIAGPVTLSGTGLLTINATSNVLDRALIDGAGTLTNASGHTISGRGNIYAALTNQGTVTASFSGDTLQLLSGPKVNTGTMSAVSGGVLQFAGITVNNTGGVIRGDSGTVIFNGPTVSGGSLTTTGTGILSVNTATMSGLTVTSDSVLNVNNAGTLTVPGPNITNSGVITVNPQGAGNLTRITVSGNTNLTGNGDVVLNASSNVLDRAFIDGAGILTVGGNQEIRGRGNVYVATTNNGTISADQAANALQLLSTPKTNAGLMRALGGGTLIISGIAVTQTGSGQILADNGTVTLSNAAIVSGPISATNGGIITNTGTSSLTNVSLTAGNMQVNNATILQLAGSTFTNNGSIVVNPEGAGNLTHIDAAVPALTIAGAGEIILNASANVPDRAYFHYTAASNVLTNAAAHTIRGRGNIYTNMINQGTITADNVNGEALQLLEQPKSNSGLMRAIGGGTLRINGIALTQTGAGTIQAAGTGSKASLTSAAIIGGSVESAAGGLTNNTGVSTFDGVKHSGTMHVNNASVLRLKNTVVNNGMFVVNPEGAGNLTHIDREGEAVITGTGEIVLNATSNVFDRAYLHAVSLSTDHLSNGPNHTIAGNGHLYGTIFNDGKLSPGHLNFQGEVGRLTINGGTIDCGETSNVIIQASSASVVDTITGSGSSTFECDGKVTLSFIAGFEPGLCQTYTIINVAGGVSGVFEEVVAPITTSPDRRWRAFYTGTTVQLRLNCYADFNGDCVLDFFDFLEFQNQFNAGNLIEADCDNSGVLDFFDFLCFQNFFNTGC